jgi:hypothetical protein
VNPQVRVLRGSPDDVELAALVAGIASGAFSEQPPATGERPDAAARRRWREAARPLRDPLAPGRDAWRWSARG